MVAYHEVGHALVGTLLPGGGKVAKISIVPRGMAALGYTLQMPTEDRFLMAESELRDQIATLLGGRAAEEIIFNSMTNPRRMVSDETAKAIDEEVKEIVETGHQQALAILNNNRELLEQIAQEILETEVISVST